MNEARSRFGPVARRTLAEEIREQIQEQIVSGLLAPGSRLPSERQLCEDFNVARTSVREAIQGLMSLGLVVRRGNRAYVAEELPVIRANDWDGQRGRVQNLFEVRRVIELPMIELAAARATEEERAHIVAIGARFGDDLPLEQFRALDREFHWTLANASHNPLLAELYQKVLVALFDSEEWAAMLAERRNAEVVRGIIHTSGEEHRRIAEAIQRGDEVRALDAMESHLDTVESRIVGHLL
ncbi:MAG: FadR/GntR family transcriptional regulator [Acidimicrobiia bacterium]